MGEAEPEVVEVYWQVLNLGCGMRTWDSPGVLNVDLTKHSPEVDEAWDLNDVPWPWEDGSFDEVSASAVFEHLDIDLLAAMNESWRVLRTGGLIDLKLPYWKHETSYNDLQHRWRFGLGIFDQLDPRHPREHKYWYYTPRKWLIVQVGLNKAGSSVCGKLRKISTAETDRIRHAWKTGEDQARLKPLIARWLAMPKGRRALTEVMEPVK